MFQPVHPWPIAARSAAPAMPFGKARSAAADPGLVVDLGRDLFSRRWWRGAATLFLLCAAAGLAAPGLEPLPGGATPDGEPEDRIESKALGIAPLRSGSTSGLSLTPRDTVLPLPFAPERKSIAFSARLGRRDSIEGLLLRSGTAAGDSRIAAQMLTQAGSAIAAGTEVDIALGSRSGDGRRPLQRLSVKAGLGLVLIVQREGGALRLERHAAKVDSTPIRIRGTVGSGLYWSLRSAGVTPATAAEYLRAIASRIDVGADIAPFDRFDLVVANRRAENGESLTGPLLLASLDRASGEDVQLMKWTIGGRTGWYDGNLDEQGSDSMLSPVAGPVTSTFGTRVHPILRFRRFHSGVDFGAASGSPIMASADGEVVSAGWAGGYGRQVRLAHGGGIVTTYSHMSAIAAQPGSIVRRGEVIGYVGSSGLSTGPHLHYEVRIGGRAVDPLTVRFHSRVATGPELNAFKARLKSLLAIGGGRQS